MGVNSDFSDVTKVWCYNCEKGVAPLNAKCREGDWVVKRTKCSVCRRHLSNERLPVCIVCGEGTYKRDIGKSFLERYAVVCKLCLVEKRNECEE